MKDFGTPGQIDMSVYLMLPLVMREQVSVKRRIVVTASTANKYDNRNSQFGANVNQTSFAAEKCILVKRAYKFSEMHRFVK